MFHFVDDIRIGFKMAVSFTLLVFLILAAACTGFYGMDRVNQSHIQAEKSLQGSLCSAS